MMPTIGLHARELGKRYALRLESSPEERFTPAGSSCHASAPSCDSGSSTPSRSICRLRSSMRSCSRGIVQSRAVSGLGASVGRRATMIDGNTSTSSNICLACPKSTTDSIQASSRKNRRNGSRVAGLHPLVRDDEGQQPAGLQQPEAQFVEVDVEIGHAVIGAVGRFQIGLDRAQQFLPDVGRVGDHHVEPALGEDFGEGRLPVERLRDGRPGRQRCCCPRGSCGQGWSAPCRARPS